MYKSIHKFMICGVGKKDRFLLRNNHHSFFSSGIDLVSVFIKCAFICSITLRMNFSATFATSQVSIGHNVRIVILTI